MSFSKDFLDDLRREVAKSLARRLPGHGIAITDALVDAVALDVAMDIQYEWAGQQLYVNQSSPYLRQRIFSEFTGNNVPELVRRYRLSTKTIYDYIRAGRAREKHPGQVALPGV